MKKSIGPVLGLYPTPVTILGTEFQGKVNWINVAHVGVAELDKIIVSVNKNHYSNKAIRECGILSVNLVSEEMLERADYAGLVSGAKVDKSALFDYEKGAKTGAPMIIEAKVSMECKVMAVFDADTHDNFMLDILDTRVDENCLNEAGKIDYEKVKPVLFEMVNRQYFSIGKPIGKCWSMGKQMMQRGAQKNEK